jgi:opacity protein-like surface antigen
MTTIIRPALIVVTLWLAAVQPAAAQAERPIGARGFLDFESETFLASDTFNAIFGDHRGTFVGVGGQFRWKNILFEVSASQFKESGERVFISNGEVFKLGIPTTVTIRPIELTGAWRFRPVWHFRPYAGGGIGWHHYKESSDFAEPSENVERTDRSYHVVGGAEIRLWRWIAAAAEVRYRTVRDAIGEAGASKEYGEDDLGGTSLAFRILVIAW